MFSTEQIEVLSNILKNRCKEYTPIPRECLFEDYLKQTGQQVELYLFKKELSAAVKDGTISGYQVKPGRNGGVCKCEPTETIVLNCKEGVLQSEIPISAIEKFKNKWFKNRKNK